jgi:hypothetical protein
MAIESLLGNFTLQWELWYFSWAICGVVWFIIWILIAIWVYRDAEERGMSGALWLIIVIFTGLIGIIIYLVVRTDRPQYGYYPQQQQPYQPYPPYQQQPPPAQAPPPAAAPPAQPPGAARFCSNCGGSLPEAAAHCPNCGAKV